MFVVIAAGVMLEKEWMPPAFTGEHGAMEKVSKTMTFKALANRRWWISAYSPNPSSSLQITYIGLLKQYLIFMHR